MNLTSAVRLSLTRRSLARFSQAVMPAFEVSACHALMIEFIEKLLSGEIRKLAIVAPPRHGKTTIANVLTPAFVLGRNPTETIISVSYGSELSETWGRRVRNILDDSVFREVFPGCRLSPDSAAAYRFTTTAGGEYNAVGRGGPITGKGASLLVLDDLIKDQVEAQSETTCKNIIEWMQSVALTRLTPKGRVLALATRWSERDPTGWILQQPGWRVLHLPAVCLSENDPLGRAIGEALWPERYPLETLEAFKADVGPRVFQILYQGNVAAAEGVLFRRDWFRHFDTPPERFTRVVQSWDTAFRAGKENDYSVCATIGMTDNGFYLLSLYRAKPEFPELKRQVGLLADLWKPSEIFVEDRGSGQSLIQELKVSTSYPVVPVKIDRDKETRASAITGYFEAGRVFFPRPESAHWVVDLEDELASFPGGLHDDCVDSLTQALNCLRDGSGAYGVLELMKKGWNGLVGNWPLSNKPVLNSNEEARAGIDRTASSPQCTSKEASPTCPMCSAACVNKCSGQWRCGQCGHQWWISAAPEIPRVSRADILNGRIAGFGWQTRGRRSGAG